MKKIIALMLALAAVVAVLAACSGGEGEKETEKVKDSQKTVETEAAKQTDPQAIADALVAAGDFEAKIEQTSEDNAKYEFFGLPEGTKAVVYMSTAVSDQVAVFKTSDTEAVKGIVETYVSNRVETLENYQPEQAKKLEDNAAIVASGDLVVLLVSKASSLEAKELIEKTING